jgi:hypothetical protein
MGPSGISIAKTASNIDPLARTIIEDTLGGRKQLQNLRVANTLTDQAGLQRGVRDTPEDLQESLRRARTPAINQAWQAARDAGFDLPNTPFRPIIDSPTGGPAYEQAGRSLLDRASYGGQNVTSELARLDQMQRHLADRARMAMREGDRETADIAGNQSRTVREGIDASTAGPEYAAARALSRAMHGEQDAVQMGADLASPSVPLNLPRQATALPPEHADPLAQGYALQKLEQLLNKGNSEGALANMNTTLGREAQLAALGPQRAAELQRQLDAERVFNTTNRELTGNSTTARQLTDIAKNAGGYVGGGITGAGLAYMSGNDPWSGGFAGALLKPGMRLGKQAVEAANASRALARALAEARIMTGALEDIPLADPLADLQSPLWRDALARLMARTGTSTYDEYK